MKKSAAGYALAIVVLLFLGVAFQWQESTVNDGGTRVLIRTNRFSGVTQVFHPTIGWVRPGSAGNAELDGVVAKIIAERHAH